MIRIECVLSCLSSDYDMRPSSSRVANAIRISGVPYTIDYSAGGTASVYIARKGIIKNDTDSVVDAVYLAMYRLRKSLI